MSRYSIIPSSPAIPDLVLFVQATCPTRKARTFRCEARAACKTFASLLAERSCHVTRDGFVADLKAVREARAGRLTMTKPKWSEPRDTIGFDAWRLQGSADSGA